MQSRRNEPLCSFPRAKGDLDEIWEYTRETWGERQAELYIRNIQSAIDVVSSDPRLERRCDDVRAGYRKFFIGSHVLFFRVVDHQIDIVRILHARMDFRSHF